MKRTFLLAIPFVAVFTAVSFLDQVLQRDIYTQLESYVKNPFSAWLIVFGRAIKWGLFLSAPAFLFGRRSRTFYLILVSYLALVETIEVVTKISYGMVLDGDWLMIVLASSTQEMREFFGQFSWTGVSLTVLGLSAALAAGLFIFSRIRYPAASRPSVAVGVLFCLPFVTCNLILEAPQGAGNNMMYTFLPIDTVRNYALFTDIAKTAREPQLPENTLAAPDRIKETLGVFVIGESATRNHWHLYGYGRPTTPVMSGLEQELVVFKDVRAIYPSTAKSLRLLLTEASRADPSETRSTFPQQCAAAGYECSLFSAHSRWGRWEGIESLLFAGCDTKYYLHEQPGSRPESLDNDLLPPVREHIRSSPAGQVVFLHLMGSHAPPLYRYPPQRSIYPRYEGDVAPGITDPGSFMAYRTDLYDNTIAFTDLILGQTIDMLKSLHRKSFLVYLSDHGETPSSPNWRDNSSPDLFEIPFIIWFSPEYRASYSETVAAITALANEPRELDRMLPLFRILVHLDRAE